MKYGNSKKSLKKSKRSVKKSYIAPILGAAAGLGALGALGLGYKYLSGPDDDIKSRQKEVDNYDEHLNVYKNEHIQSIHTILNKFYKHDVKMSELEECHTILNKYKSEVTELMSGSWGSAHDIKEYEDYIIGIDALIKHIERLITTIESSKSVNPTINLGDGEQLEDQTTDHMKLLQFLKNRKVSKDDVQNIVHDVSENESVQSEVKPKGNYEIMMNHFKIPLLEHDTLSRPKIPLGKRRIPTPEPEIRIRINRLKQQISNSESILRDRDSGRDDRASVLENIIEKQKLLKKLEGNLQFGSKRKSKKRKTLRKSRKLNKRKRSRK